MEITFRIFNPETIIPAHTAPAFGNPNAWKKNISFKAKNPLNKFYTATINKNHLRSLKDFSYEKPEKTIRIMGFGNSIMWGSHVNDNETFGYYLEKILNQQTKDFEFEFLNVGKTGWNLVNQLIYLKNEGFKYSPDLIILSRLQIEYHFLDPRNAEFSNLRYQRLNNGKIKVFLDGIRPGVKENFIIEKIFRQFDKIPFYFELTKYSQLLNQARKKISAIWSTGVFRKESENNLENFIESLNLKDSEEVEWIIENAPYVPIFKGRSLHLSQFTATSKNLTELSLILYQWFLKQLIDFTKKQNIKILMVETPVNNQVLEILPPPKTNSYFPHNKGAFIKRLLSDFIAFQRQNNVMLLFPDDVHFTPSGNRLAALLIYNFIVENQLIPEVRLNSKFDLLSSITTRLVQLSNNSIRKEIDAKRYSLFLKGWSDIKNERYSEAETNLSKYLEVDQQKQATFLLCYAYFVQKKYTKAKSCFYSIPKGFVLSSLIYRILTEIHLENEDSENAFKTLDEWKNQYPFETKESAQFNYLLAKSFLQIKKEGFAELYLKLAILKNPKDYLISFALGSLYFKQKKYLNAIQESERTVKLNPDELTSYLLLSLANFEIGNIKEGNRLIKEFVWRCRENCQKILDKSDWLQDQ